MPNLDLKSSHEYWNDYPDPMIYRVVSFMESVESFTVDGDPALEDILMKIGLNLEAVDKFQLGEESNFVTTLCFLKMSRLLRTLQAIDTIEPGSASRLLMYAEENGSKDNADPVVKLFLRRNIIFERLRLLGRIFHPDRFQTLLNALEKVE